MRKTDVRRNTLEFSAGNHPKSRLVARLLVWMDKGATGPADETPERDSVLASTKA